MPSRMSKPYNSSNPFLPYEPSHRADWPEYEEYLAEKLASVRQQVTDLVSQYGPVPLKLKVSNNPSGSDHAFTATRDESDTRFATLEDLEYPDRQTTYTDEVYEPTSAVYREMTALGIDASDLEVTGTIDDLMGQYEAFLVQQELFEQSDVKAAMLKNNINYSITQWRESILLLVPDSRHATYVKMTYA